MEQKEFMLRSMSVKETKTGKLYLSGVTTVDFKSYTVKIWDYVPEADAFLDKLALNTYGYCRAGSVKLDTYNGIEGLILRGLQEITEEEAVELGLIPTAPNFIEPEIFKRLMDILVSKEREEEKSYGSAFIKNLFEKHIGNKAAAMTHHHAYRNGLYAHSVQVANTALTILKSAGIEEYNVALVIAGGLLHDVGKLLEYEFISSGLAVAFTERGKLMGHLALGVEYMGKVNASKKIFDQETLYQIQHIIASHHRLPEWGAIVEPKTPEAKAIAWADNANANILSSF